MDERVLAVWRVLWPKAIPEHEYETALLQANLISTAGRKAEPKEAPAPERKAAPPLDAPGDLLTVTVAEAAQLRGVTPQTVSQLIKSGTLVSYGGRPQRVSRAALLALAPPKGGPSRGRTADATPRDLISTAEAARLLGLDLTSVSKRVRMGKLRNYSSSPHVMQFSRAEVMAAPRKQRDGGPGAKARAKAKAKAKAEPEPKRAPPEDLIPMLEVRQMTGWNKSTAYAHIYAGRLVSYGSNPLKVSRAAIRALMPSPRLVEPPAQLPLTEVAQ